MWIVQCTYDVYGTGPIDLLAKFPVIKSTAAESNACVRVALSPKGREQRCCPMQTKRPKRAFFPENVQVFNLMRKRQDHLRLRRFMKKKKKREIVRKVKKFKLVLLYHRVRSTLRQRGKGTEVVQVLCLVVSVPWTASGWLHCSQNKGTEQPWWAWGASSSPQPGAR